MTEFLERLQPRGRRGSKARCHYLTHGSASVVASRLTELGAPYATVSLDDHWMPQGFESTDEAQLHVPSPLLDEAIRQALLAWWLAAPRGRSTSPTFDIASTCSIDGRPGLLLVEAKAHAAELSTGAKRLKPDASIASTLNHRRIADAVAEAREGLTRATGLTWTITSNSHYQVSNRFAWAWKLTALGVPVVLVYLGFLKAEEMADRGRPIPDADSWERMVHSHAAQVVPPAAWGKRWMSHGQALVPLIRSMEIPLSILPEPVAVKPPE